MFINWALQEITMKIVYYGPALSGKTTNLEYIYNRIAPSHRGEMVTLRTREDRTIFFDFMQIELGTIGGKKPKFSLYTVPGQDYYASSRKIILKGADGIVFVADSQWQRLNENIESMLSLERNLIADGQSLGNIPWVLQYNKRDLSPVHSIATLQEKLNFNQVPYVEAVAVQGKGVVETLKTIINLVVSDIEQKLKIMLQGRDKNGIQSRKNTCTAKID
ncbi:gliding-motility protein MglA [candidate division KSB1 bacterium]|nr:MAG: gliding-motility protein MglA [candidate division KSB1 bacterium]